MYKYNYLTFGIYFTILSLQAHAQQEELNYFKQVEFVCTKLEKENGFEFKVIASYPSDFLLLNAAQEIQGIATSEKEYGINIVKNKPTFYFESSKYLKYSKYFNSGMVTQIKTDNTTQIDFLYYKSPHDSVYQYEITTGKPLLLDYRINGMDYKFYNLGFVNFEKDEFGNDRLYRQFYHYVEEF